MSRGSQVDYSLGLSFARPLNRQQMCKNPELFHQCSKSKSSQPREPWRGHVGAQLAEQEKQPMNVVQTVHMGGENQSPRWRVSRGTLPEGLRAVCALEVAGCCN